MTTTSNDIGNQAIILMGGNQPAVAGQWPNFDNSAAGKALNKLYGPCVQTVGRQFEWDMARSTVALVLSGNTAPFPWTYEYLYPTNGIEVWQVAPPSVVDPNNPLPTTWVVANAVVTGQQQRVVQTDIQNALAIYNNNPNENTWDALFREAVARLLASELAIALGGRPETSQVLITSGAAFENIGQSRDS